MKFFCVELCNISRQKKSNVRHCSNQLVIQPIPFKINQTQRLEKGERIGNHNFFLYFLSPVGLYYKTFYGRNFCCIVISQSVCLCHSLPPLLDIFRLDWSPPVWSHHSYGRLLVFAIVILSTVTCSLVILCTVIWYTVI